MPFCSTVLIVQIYLARLPASIAVSRRTLHIVPPEARHQMLHNSNIAMDSSVPSDAWHELWVYIAAAHW